MQPPPLLPERRDQLDFFVCDTFDTAMKDDLGSMEHPFFTLSKKPDRAIRHYENNGNSITVTPSVLGHATIFDKDILIYCISQLIAALNEGRPTSRTVRVTAYDVLKATNRPIGGDHYRRIEAALTRLRGTQIITNIPTGRERRRRGFGIIDEWTIIERSPTNSRMVSVEITLSKWLYNAVLGKEVLTIHRDYFRLRKPIERRLYEIARKHCGGQRQWTCSIALLYKKSGSSAEMKEFRRSIRDLAKSQHLPEYRIMYRVADDKVTFYNRQTHGHKAMLNAVLDAHRTQQRVSW